MKNLINKTVVCISVVMLSFACIGTNVYADSENDLRLVRNRLNLILDKLTSYEDISDYDLDKDLRYVRGILNNAYRDLDNRYKNEKNIDKRIRISKLLNIATSYGLVIDYIQAYSNTQNNKYLQYAIGSKAIADLLYK